MLGIDAEDDEVEEVDDPDRNAARFLRLVTQQLRK